MDERNNSDLPGKEENSSAYSGRPESPDKRIHPDFAIIDEAKHGSWHAVPLQFVSACRRWRIFGNKKGTPLAVGKGFLDFITMSVL